MLIMFKRILVLVGLALSLSANAATISHYGYTHDTETNIVTGGGVEWLRWDQTRGMSANEALATYRGDGWELASNEQVAALLTPFSSSEENVNGSSSWSPPVWDADENTTQYFWLGYGPNDYINVERFVSVFGGFDRSGLGDSDSWLQANAIFGKDLDGDGFLNRVAVADEYQEDPYWNTDLEEFESVEVKGRYNIYSDTTSGTVGAMDWSDGRYSVALVRVSEVPVPAATWLFGSALIGLAGIKRNK